MDEAATNPSVGINSAIDYYTKETGNTKLADNNTDMANDNTRAAEDNASTVSCDRPQCSKWALDCYTVGTYTDLGSLCGTSDPSVICDLFD